MELLRELVRFVRPQNLRKVEIFTKNKSVPSRLQKLYQSIANNPKSTEKEIVQEALDVELGSPTYSQLKSRLTKRLINNLFLIDPNEAQFNNYSRAYLNGRKLIFAANILYTMGGRGSATVLAEKAFRLADKYSLSLIALEALNMLWNNAVVAVDRRKIAKYSESYEKYLDLRVSESKVLKYYLKMRQIEFDSRNYTDEFVDEIYNELLKEFSGPADKYNSANYIANLYSSLCIISRMKNETLDVIKYSKEAINKLNQYHYLPEVYVLNFYLFILRAAIGLRDFSYGEDVKEAILDLADSLKGVNSLFVYQGVIELGMQTGRYDVALEIYGKMVKLPIYKKAPVYLVETYEIFAAYLNILKSEKIIVDNENILKGFKMGKFMNASIEISKFKEGLNVAFLLVQIIFFLNRKDYEEVIDRIDSLRNYAIRNLRHDRTYRAYCFSRMVETLRQSDFHLSGVLRRSASWLKKLGSKPVTHTNDSLLSEIIPFEEQWKIILSYLEKKHQVGKWKEKYLANLQR